MLYFAIRSIGLYKIFSIFVQKTALNYLAHIFLSGNDSRLQVGNFIGDFVKGSNGKYYPKTIRKGIALHRKIDHYTDHHKVVRETLDMMRPEFGRYSGIILDMYFDYFLATNFATYSNKSLNVFATRFYIAVVVNYRHLPLRVKRFIFHLVFSNRLKKYASLKGLQQSLEIMGTYKSKAIKPEKSIAYLIENHMELERRFHQFFPDLIKFVEIEIHL
jgi:acyl carrier protein phosphodiesterase